MDGLIEIWGKKDREKGREEGRMEGRKEAKKSAAIMSAKIFYQETKSEDKAIGMIAKILDSSTEKATEFFQKNKNLIVF